SSDKIEISGEATYDKSLIYIKDFGIGFSMEDESKIYEVFRKLNPDEEYEGIGIGLPLTKRILEINDGLISVKSTKDEGTTFTVALPLRG
ncbi:MAG: ATP-binding protein, partial [Marinoscillum sp.]